MTSPSLKRALALFFAACLLAPPAAGQRSITANGKPAAKSPVLVALEEELQRAQKILKAKGDPAPYLIGYQVADTHYNVVGAQYGALNTSQAGRMRLLDVDVRVGDYPLDSTHRTAGTGGYAGGGGSAIPLTLDDDKDALKSAVWMETDRKYRAAVERLIQIKANQQIKVEEEDKSADFSRETPQVAVGSVAAPPKLDRALWEKKVKEYSALFNQYPDILESSVTLTADATTKYLVNTEGALLQHGGAHARLMVFARTKAEDGMELYRHETFDAVTPDRLPADATVRAAIERMAGDLLALRNAPVIEPYTGPAILSGRASGVFFHEIFGHRIEGHRQKDEDGGQTFTKRVNQPVLPAFLSVYDDPTLASLQLGGAEVDLNGHYQFDDEGVRAERVTVVENGILKNFLMSRSPIKGFPKSNGHGRKQPGLRAVGRQGNLIVQASQTVPEAKLRELLIAECKKQGKPYGLVFKDISGGFTTTGRSSPQAFQVTPVLVYRVYADGRADELVRGVDLIGTPLTSFSQIVAAGDRPEVFNGMCGAESGWVPVATISPSILTTQIEVQKKPKSNERLPILPPPSKEN
jgi:TldD protein